MSIISDKTKKNDKFQKKLFKREIETKIKINKLLNLKRKEVRG